MIKVNATIKRMDKMEQHVVLTDAVQQTCLQKVGLVRFNAFEDVGGEQSFAVALIDAKCNGVILSSVYSRSDVRVYSKALADGHASHPLTEEEEKALLQARGK